MLIESITPIKFSKKKNRYKVRLIDGSDFVLYKKEIDRYGIVEQEELKDTVYEELLREIFIPRAKMRAMHLLCKMDRSEANLRNKLKESGYPKGAIDAAIDYVSDYNYINDRRYVENYIRNKRGIKSARCIIEDLQNKGIEKSVIEEVIDYLEAESEEPVFNESVIILEYLERKLGSLSVIDEKSKKRAVSHLIRAGFSYSTIKEVAKEKYL